MGRRFPTWEPAVRCTSGPSQGALALMRWFVEEFGDEGGYNLGIYNCRPVRGGGASSLHGEGRACDFGFPVGDPDGDECRDRLLDRVGRLGIQCIIYERRIFSKVSPDGRYYTGVNPHYDHLHVELSRESAAKLTFATVEHHLNPSLPKHRRGTRSLREGKEGTDVRWLQRKLNRMMEAELTDDGIFGPATAAAVQNFEEVASEEYPRLKVDGKVGAVTWVALGVTPALKK